MSPDRLAHFFFAMLLAVGYFHIRKTREGIERKKTWLYLPIILPCIYIGTTVPDLLRMLGLMEQKEPFLHSALPYGLVYLATKPIPKWPEIRVLVRRWFAFGLASHFILDAIFQNYDVVLIPTNFLDIAWLLLNAAVLFIVPLR